MTFANVNIYLKMSKRPIDVFELLEGSKLNSSLGKLSFISKNKREKLAKNISDNGHNLKTNLSQRPRSPQIHRVKRDSTSEDSSNFASSESAAKDDDSRSTGEYEDPTILAYRPLALRRGRNNYEEDDLALRNSRHWSEKKLEEMEERDWRIFREDYNIRIKGPLREHPLRSWQESSLPSVIKNIVLEDLGYGEPTPIQRAAVPIGLEYHDILGIAETGSGKTLAYLLPLISYILQIDPRFIAEEHQRDSNYNNPLGLIVVPTRELAIQVSKVAKTICSYLSLTVVTIIGGHQYEETVNSITNGVHLVVATPGRLVDSIQRGIISLDLCCYCVLDEADRMIEMGFEKDITAIFGYLPSNLDIENSWFAKFIHIKRRVTLMFTATLSLEIEKVTRRFLLDQREIYVGNPGKVVDNIDQKFSYFPDEKSQDKLEEERLKKLLGILKSHTYKDTQYLIIIFTNYKKTCDYLSEKLNDKGYGNNLVIHGSKSQEARENAIQKFRNMQKGILIATDVAARGLDIPNISLVINYHFPKKFDEYIHRIGRTGRAGSSGLCYSFVDDSSSDLFLELKRYLIKGKKKCPPWLLSHPSTQTRYVE